MAYTISFALDQEASAWTEALDYGTTQIATLSNGEIVVAASGTDFQGVGGDFDALRLTGDVIPNLTEMVDVYFAGVVPHENDGDLIGLTNGNFVHAFTAGAAGATDVYFVGFDGVSPTRQFFGSIADSESDSPALTALAGGGFAIVSIDRTGTDHINLDIYNAAGTRTISRDLATSQNSFSPAVTTLSNGNIAIMWSQQAGGVSSLWSAVYSPNGAIVSAPTLRDAGGTTNVGVSLAAIPGGGFLAAYTDNGWGSGSDITIGRFDNSGNVAGFGFYNLSKAIFPAETSTETSPQIIHLTGQFFAVAWDGTFFLNKNNLALFDTANGKYVAHEVVFGYDLDSKLHDVDIAKYKNGASLYYSFTDLTRPGGVTVEEFRPVRVINGDAANDYILASNDMAHDIRGGTGDDSIYGSMYSDTIYGNDGNDWLNGGGDKDYYYGGKGNDTYFVYVESALQSGLQFPYIDKINENPGEGTDRVFAEIDYVLDDNVENLTLIEQAIVGGGNALKNVITGNALNNELSGEGGNDTLDGKEGADLMVGGFGNDTYVVDNAGDIVQEEAGQGTKDTVKSYISWTVIDHIENLTLMGGGHINGTGNIVSNIIKGNKGNNTLYGMDGFDTLSGGSGNDKLYGGAGKDKLTGNAGNDWFVFDSIEPSAYFDTITDFAHGVDKIVLDKSDFTAFSSLPSGASINAGDFVTGTVAQNQLQNIIYNPATGALYYDADGSGGAGQVQIAQLTNLALLTYQDISIL